MNIAVIPARGGSKRIPRKNIKEFCGKPIISYPIEAAIKSGLFDQVVVSTDDEEIAQVALAYGASVPFTRPAELANDYAPTIPVIQHAIKALAISNLKTACCIYPAAAFLTTSLLTKAYQLINENAADFVMPVIAYSCPFERALKMDDQGLVSMRNLDNLDQRTQDCEVLYHDVGQFYFGSAQAWQNPSQFYDRRVKSIQVPKYRAHDIDTLDDWQLAELVFRQLDTLP
ncbi:pseudaminic acid cytidylyltransferase [Thiomicrospira microaerophila]|uniref:pseudaminic acid cytidylyltransferase n=1 Tax=Thiomicrospira microaerophila TaxID=406020 RepID=UPI0005C7F740|nr:pseudaminic acid cytidylyltransferase [Thiomicrospira microaerophila]